MSRYDEMMMQCSEAIKPIRIPIQRGEKVMWLKQETETPYGRIVKWNKCVVDAQRMKREM